MPTDVPIQRVAIVGTGLIGASWAAHFLAHGLDVTATDPAPGAEHDLRRYVERVWPVLVQLGLAPGADPARLSFSKDLKTAVAGADFVQENGPERENFKVQLFAELDALLPPDVILASSSSGLTMSAIQHDCRHPGRCVIGHPFNPPHLIPLVEIVGGRGHHRGNPGPRREILHGHRQADHSPAQGGSRARRQPPAGRALA